jgi:predicted  nucleic acid-binding Zn-ribbon protein
MFNSSCKPDCNNRFISLDKELKDTKEKTHSQTELLIKLSINSENQLKETADLSRTMTALFTKFDTLNLNVIELKNNYKSVRDDIEGLKTEINSVMKSVINPLTNSVTNTESLSLFGVAFTEKELDEEKKYRNIK